jgi:hypothetical protein
MDQTSISIGVEEKKALADYCKEHGSLKMVVVVSDAVREFLERRKANDKEKEKVWKNGRYQYER